MRFVRRPLYKNTIHSLYFNCRALGRMQLLLLIALVVGVLARDNYFPPDLHTRACIGLPFDSVHLNGLCVVEPRGRASCGEIQRFFRTLNTTYTPILYHDVHPLIKKRLRQEPAIQNAAAREQLCVNREKPQRNVRCPTNFIEFENKCYVATSRRVPFEIAQEECAMIKGSLVTENTPKVVEFLNYMVDFYIHASVFTGFNKIHKSKYQKAANFNVEVNYAARELLYVPPTSSRQFICVVPIGVYTVPLYKSIPLLPFPDNITIHDIDEPQIPLIPNFGRYLADLFEFKSVAEEDKSSQFLYRVDLLESPPANSEYIRSLGSLVLPIEKGNGTREMPTRVAQVCSQLKLLYRAHNTKNNIEFFTLRPSASIDLEYIAMGYCSIQEGYCGTNAPIFTQSIMHSSSRPLCYGFTYERDLDAELEAQKPFRYAQIASRIDPIFSTYFDDHYNTHYHRIANSGGIKSKQVFQLINPLFADQLKSYCSKHLVPLYRVVDYINDNSMLVVNKTEIDYYRKNRNQYEEEELLGFCSKQMNYCGASIAIRHYTVFHEYANHIDSVYQANRPKNQTCLGCDKYNYEGTLCYGF